MKNTIKRTFLLLSLLVIGLVCTPKAQSIKILAGSTLNGAMNGVILGGATMALQNSNDFDPVRVGVGLGTLYGIGTGVYDVTRISAGEQLIVSGTFNDGTNTSIIVLLDTFYGAAAGAIISTSVTLIGKEPVVEGLQYGSGVGAWVGFGFGLFDAFVLAKKPASIEPDATNPSSVNGLISVQSNNSKFQAGFLSPAYTSFTSITSKTIQVQHSLKLEVLNLKIRL